MKRSHAMVFRYDDTMRAALEAVKERDGMPYHEQVRRAVVAWIATRDLPSAADTIDRHAGVAARLMRLARAEEAQAAAESSATVHSGDSGER